MRGVCALYEQLEPQPPAPTPGWKALQAYFAAVDPADGAWALRPVARQNDASAPAHRKAPARNRPGRLSSAPKCCFDDCHARVATVPKPSALLLPHWRCPKPS